MDTNNNDDSDGEVVVLDEGGKQEEGQPQQRLHPQARAQAKPQQRQQQQQQRRPPPPPLKPRRAARRASATSSSTIPATSSSSRNSSRKSSIASVISDGRPITRHHSNPFFRDMQPSSGEDDVTPERKMSVDRISEGEDYGDGVQGRTMDTASDVVSGRSRRATTKLAPKTGASSKRQRKPNPFAPSIAETPTTTSTTPPPSTPTTTMETRKTATTKTRATAAPTPSPSRSQTQTPSNRSGVASTTPETQTPSIHPLHVTLCSLTFASLAFNSFRNTADEARDRGVRHGLLLGRFTRETVTSKDDDREHVSEERRACVVTGARPLPLSILDIMQSRGDALTHAISGDRDQVVGWFSTRTCDGITPTLHDKWLHRLVSTTFNPETCVGCVLRMAPDRTTTAKTTCSFYRHINGTFSRVTHELRVRHVQPYPPTTSSLGRGSGTLDFLQPSLQRWSLDADVAAMEAAVTEAIQKLLQLEEKLAATAIAAAVAASHNTPDLM